MKIAIIGYGKMGKEIEQIALDRGHSIVSKINSTSSFDLNHADVAIEFTRPEVAIANLNKCFTNNTPVVTGTTGWLDKLQEVTNNCMTNNGKLLHASNFSIGVNIFFKINQQLAKLLDKVEGYEPKMEEIHHTQKLDAPSGTAITLANDILTNFNQKKRWVNQQSDNKSDLVIVSKREPNVPGTHSVTYTSLVDEIEIKHTAFSRKGFALGAVVAAEWIINQKSGVYTMQNVLN